MIRACIGLIRKEFIQVVRDRVMLRLIFLMPVLQLLLLGYAVNLDVRDIDLDVYDFDHSQLSRELRQSMTAGDYFVLPEDAGTRSSIPLWELDERFKTGDAEVALIIPEDLTKKIGLNEPVTVGLVADGSNAYQARTGLGYAAQIIGDYSRHVTGLQPFLKLRYRHLYNPELESVYFMVPGIVATLLTMVTVMLTAMAIVREREMGTLEQVLVTPISIPALLAGKLTTFAILGFAELVIALTFGVFWFGIPFVGSPVLLFALALLYLVTTLGIGMFFSTVTSTQQQAMFFAWFFSVFAILTSGFFTPIHNMPQWMQWVTLVNPLRYFMEIARGIMLKGAGIGDLLPQIGTLAVFGPVIFTLAALRFRKRAA